MSLNNIVPGVYSSVSDYEDYVPAQPSSKGCVGIICEKGRDNELVLVDRPGFIKEFGEPNINYTKNAAYGMGPYVADSYLQMAQGMYVCRVMPRSATYANLTIAVDAVDLNDAPTLAPEIVYTKNCNQKTDRIITEDGQFAGRGLEYENVDGDEYVTYGKVPLVSFFGIGRGQWYNNVVLELRRHPGALISAGLDDKSAEYVSGKGLYILNVFTKQRFSDGDINSSVDAGVTVSPYGTDVSYTPKFTANSFIDYSLVESYEVTFDPNSVDSGGASNYIQTVINQNSDYIRCDANEIALSTIYEGINASPEPTIGCNFASAFVSDDSDVAISMLMGGNGVYVDDTDGDKVNYRGLFQSDGRLDTDVAKLLLAQFYAGVLPKCESQYDEAGELDFEADSILSEIMDTRNVKFDLVFDAGYPNDVKYSIAALAETRKDVLAILDNGNGGSIFKNGTRAMATRAGGGDLFSINSPYCALYEPYVEVYDIFTGKHIMVPPSVQVAKVVARSDREYEMWEPLAGTNRAYVDNIRSLKYNATFLDREKFMERQINPIISTPRGYAIMSQRTTMRKNSPRQDINVVRLINYVDRSLKEYCDGYLFELNNEETHAKIASAVRDFLAEVKSRRGIRNEPTIKVTASDVDIKLRRCRVDIWIEPERAIEQIHLFYYVK